MIPPEKIDEITSELKALFERRLGRFDPADLAQVSASLGIPRAPGQRRAIRIHQRFVSELPARLGAFHLGIVRNIGVYCSIEGR